MKSKMRIKCPDLGLTLASNALREALQHQKPVLPITLEELQGLCARERRPRILAGYLRWQREEISRLLARVLVENVSALEEEFLVRHYRDNRSVHYLALRLPASERHLYAMHERILRRLSSLLFYRASTADAYSPIVLQNLLSIIDMRIGTFVLRAELPLAAGWLESLYDARTRCRSLLSHGGFYPTERREERIRACDMRQDRAPICRCRRTCRTRGRRFGRCKYRALLFAQIP